MTAVEVKLWNYILNFNLEVNIQIRGNSPIIFTFKVLNWPIF